MRRKVLAVIFVGLLWAFVPASARSASQEVIELARALRNDPDSIYQYVYNNIETLPLYGSLKGPLGALIDGNGTAFDQAELMFQLLQQAGYAPVYRFGLINLTGAQLTSWLGTDNSFNALNTILGSGGFPGQGHGGLPDPNIAASADIGWAWVSVPIGGTEYFFDPATKMYNQSSGLPNLASVLGYTQSNFLSDAQSGATITGTSVTGLNRTNIRNNLATYATSLATYLKTNYAAASPVEVFGGKTIQQLAPFGTPLRQTSLPYTVGTVTSGSSIPNTYRAQLTITIPGASASPLTFNSADIYGRRLSLFFDSTLRPTLYLDGVAVPGSMGTAASGNPAQVSIPMHASHPYADTGVNPDCGSTPVSFADSCFTWPFDAGTAASPAAYALPIGWGGAVSRNMVERRRKTLIQNMAAQATPNGAAETVLGESLAIIGYTYQADHGLIRQLMGRATDVTIVGQHVLAAVEAYQGTPPAFHFAPVVELFSNAMFMAHNHPYSVSSPDDIEMAAVWMTEQETGSHLESSAIDQTQPGNTALSTTKLLDVAMQSGPIFDINNTTVAGNDAPYYFSTLRPQMVSSYNAFDLTTIDAKVNAGNRIIAPRNGATQVNSWTGMGYFSFRPGQSTGGAYIGGHLGGQSSTAQTASQIATALSLFGFFGSDSYSGTGFGLSLGGLWANKLLGADPVNLVTGDYLYQHEDLSVGSGEHPFKLAFQRYYDSGRYPKNGPLGYGWTHNLAITALQDTDPYEALGVNSAINGAAAFVALYVAQDILLNTSPYIKPLPRVLMGAAITTWMMDQLKDNAVKVTRPGSVEQFTKLADGSYNPPLGSGSSLTGSSGSYVYKTTDQTALTFNSVGNLSTWHHPSGPTVTLAYNGSSQLTSVANGMGRTLTLSYTGDRITSVSDGTGRSTSYTYDTPGNLATFKDPDNKTTTYEYADPGPEGLLHKIFYPSNPSNPFITNFYDNLARIKTQADANNNVTTLYLAGNFTEVDDPTGTPTYSFFTPRGKLWSQVDGLSNITYHLYDGLDRLTQTVFPEGNTALYSYDAKSNLTSRVRTPKPGSGLANLVESFTYHSTYNKPVWATDANNKTTTLTYHAATGNLTDIHQPTVGGSTPHSVLTYNARGQVLTLTDPVGKVTTNTYDASTEKLLTVTDNSGALNLLTQYGYDSVGNVTSVTDPNGNVTATAYDVMRRPTQVTYPTSSGAITKFTYDADSNLLKTERFLSTGVWETTTKTYTPNFKLATVTDPAGNVTNHYYDLKDRLWTTVDPETRSTVFGYDALDRKISIANPGIQTAPLVAYTYTANGRRASLTDANAHATAYAYDGHDRPVTATYPDSSTESFTYDGNGNMLVKTTRGALTITHTYDALNRLSTKAPQGQPTVTYAYDLAGRMTSASDSGGAYTFGFDTAGRNTSANRPDGKNATFQYDANGNRMRVTWPDTYYVTYDYDALNRLTDVKESGTLALAHYTYDKLSRRTAAAYANGTSTAYGYNTNNDATSLAHTFSGSAVTFTYTYNKVHQRATMSVSDNNYLYMPENALYRYSSVNNLNQYTGGFTYDGNGNATGDGTWVFGYDAENHLISANTPVGNSTYAFDALQRRKSKTVSGTATLYLSAGDQEIAEYDGSGALLRRMVYGASLDETVAVVTPAGQKSYFHADSLGTTVALTDGSGVVADRYKYEEYGQPIGGSAGAANRFTGRRIDPEFALDFYHYRARAYFPYWGRFLQPDPIGYEGGTNLYAYVNNDPLNLTDPMGKDYPDPRGPLLSFYVAEKPVIWPFTHTSTITIDSNTHYGGITDTAAGPSSFWGGVLGTLGLPGAANLVPYQGSALTRDLREQVSYNNFIPLGVPSGQTPVLYSNRLASAAASYDNNQTYNGLPNPFISGYNSNSYTAGNILSAGGQPPPPMFIAPGYTKPLPSSIGTANGNAGLGVSSLWGASTLK